MRRPLGLIVVLAALAAPAPAGAQSVDAHAAVAACPSAAAMPARGADQAERTTLCLVNLERRRRGLRGLRANGRLAAAAARHSTDMVRRAFFGHVTPGGATLVQRIRRTGYVSGARSYALAENLAWGTGSYATPLRTVAGWMRSPGHRRNILHPGFRELGVGIVLGAPGAVGEGATYTTNFGARGRPA